MALPALATIDELAAWTQMDPDDLPEGAALVLDTASAVVRAEARQRFTRGTTTVALRPRDYIVMLPQRPVIEVELVAIAGRELRPDEYRVWRDRIILRGRACGPVVVTYVHGYEPVPADVRGVVLTLAGRMLSNPRDLRQEAVGSVSVTYAAETIGASLAPIERDQLARYRARAAVVPVGDDGGPW
ncbi:hypothetical protein [Streptomyces sp. NBC_00102]|uniref:hypothetical protein n=1 Tax=Streptomyces sp. NBC_00102 TaxID=2975652 RepID=UPI0022523F47|nr:hypothetical protein [Streptomyces sp. NBC_00102]MCX5398464.1 hypothetical protein [Streptomyces sp. NBC_00102]